MKIKQSEFMISVADYKKCPKDTGLEIAIAGKSNVGKSSFINLLANHSKLAKTSSTPGRTRLLNYFKINKGEFVLVDLPGYGFARVNDQEREKWSELIEGYFATAENLAHVLVLVDIRHEPSALDKQMIAYLHHYNIPFSVIATKADKLSRQQRINAMKIVAQTLCMGVPNITAVSSTTRLGIEDVELLLDKIIAAHNEVTVDDEDTLEDNNINNDVAENSVVEDSDI